MRWPTVKYEQKMQRFFYRLGESIGEHPWRWIVALLAFTALSSIGFLRFHQLNNARIQFTASDSPSHYEGRVLEEFLRQNGSLHMIEVMIRARDNGSLLRDEHREQLESIMKEMTDTISVIDAKSGNSLTFADMCEPYCKKNEALHALLGLYAGNYSRFETTYPTMDMLGQEVFLGANVYDVDLKEDGETIQGFRSAILHFFLVHNNKEVMYAWEDKIVDLLYSDKYWLLDSGAASDNLVGKEIRMMGTKTAPLLSVAVLCLMMFLVLSSFRHRRRESKPFESVMGALIPILAGITTIGLVSASGLAFQSIVVSTLFLLLAIGIDDVFLMLSSWHRTDSNKEIKERLALTVMDSGCSMTVTSITNLISFGNGVLSTTPVLQTFAIYSTVASVICYLYQLILFPAILALTAHKEYRKIDEDCSSSCIPEEIQTISVMRGYRENALKWLARLVTKRWMIIPIIPTLLVFWATAVYGIVNIQTDLSVQKLALPNSRLVHFKNEYDKSLKAMQTYAVIVSNPGDLRDPTQIEQIKNMVHTYENASYAFGEKSTFFWLRPYEEFLQFYSSDGEDEELSFSYKNIPAFLDNDMYQYYRGTLRINETACELNEPECIDKFLFSTGFTTLVRFNEMYPLIAEWRVIAAKFPSLNITAYTERSNFADQSVSLEPVIWETLYSEVICMGISFLVFIPDLISITSAMFSLISVNLGVFGFLALWGVGIDPFSMASLLMSIGFSVDISAHISYHYYENKAPNPRAKMEETLVEIGWPTIQGAVSTLFALSPIMIKPSYLGMVFLKTVFLVTLFGLIHGLVILPVLLNFFTSVFRRNQVHQSDSTESVTGIAPHRISIKSFTYPKEERS
ncbi:hypothetical protein PFISCL1PPCAC_1271 [Pristionchus fissidentatus]|uniref:SSD domain-containing protein n=1 Tax=Pristionchus fissidentatus TaxID=1538716 RepID=A0AAV5UUG8_9BILA|nr:hypothetical protein PFISCL1PPCAC_1271 [Pristionchus fissidentatus]